MKMQKKIKYIFISTLIICFTLFFKNKKRNKINKIKVIKRDNKKSSQKEKNIKYTQKGIVKRLENQCLTHNNIIDFPEVQESHLKNIKSNVERFEIVYHNQKVRLMWLKDDQTGKTLINFFKLDFEGFPIKSQIPKEFKNKNWRQISQLVKTFEVRNQSKQGFLSNSNISFTSLNGKLTRLESPHLFCENEQCICINI